MVKAWEKDSYIFSVFLAVLDFFGYSSYFLGLCLIFKVVFSAILGVDFEVPKAISDRLLFTQYTSQPK